jgi:hypothetical protein
MGVFVFGTFVVALEKVGVAEHEELVGDGWRQPRLAPGAERIGRVPGARKASCGYRQLRP